MTTVRLPPGTRLGPYEIQACIGAGGMGEVYRARDERLERHVAIKVLPPAVSGSDSLLARFRREAKAIAALNHPNICTVYDVGAVRLSDPPQEETQFIVMELLEGETLQHRLAYAKLDVAAVFEIGIALADAIAAAHGQGIVHRDIKPANIFLTKHGPKILDFGIAKTIETAPAASDALTRPAALTESGAAVGTVAYMSPEQVRGQDIDARSDLFSLGLVLYEMATGVPAFDEATPMAIAGAILHEPPAALPRQVRPDLPARLEEAILKALEKDRTVRTQTASELRADLTRARRGLDASSERPMVPSAALVSSQTPRAGRRFVVAAAALAVIAIAAAAAYVFRRADRGTAGVEFKARRLTTTGNADRAAISPDGALVAYVDHDNTQESLWIVQTRTTGSTQIVAAEEGVRILGATVTPDNSSVDFVKDRGGSSWEVWRVPIVGGTQRRILNHADSLVGWSPDGKQMAYLRRDLENGTFSLVVADLEGQHEQIVSTRTRPKIYPLLRSGNGNGVQRPAWSPDGKAIAVVGVEGGTRPTRVPVVVDVASHVEHAVPVSGMLGTLAWLDNDELVLTYNDPSDKSDSATSQVWRLRYPDGELQRVTNDANQYISVSVAPVHGEVVTSDIANRLGIWIGDGRTFEGQELSAAALGLGSTWPGGLGVTWMSDRLLYPSSAGRRIAILARDSKGVTELISGGTSPVSTADGRTLVYVDFATSSLWRSDADGGNRAKLVDDAVQFWPAVTPDARVIFERNNAWWVVPLGGGTPVQLGAGGVVSRPEVSPDGKLLMFGTTTTTEQTDAVVVCEWPSCARPKHASIAANRHWMPSGHVIAYPDPTGVNLLSYDVDTQKTSQLTHFTGTLIGSFAWSADGRQLAITRRVAMTNVTLFTGLRR